MNRSYSKIRHIQESNIRLEKRLLKEQIRTPIDAGYQKVSEINLPDGAYMGNIDGYEEQSKKDGLSRTAGYLYVFDKNKKFTGYVLQMEFSPRSEVSNEYLEVTNKKIDNIYSYFFKKV